MLHEFGDILNNQTGKLRIGIAFTRGPVSYTHLGLLVTKEFPKFPVTALVSHFTY